MAVTRRQCRRFWRRPRVWAGVLVWWITLAWASSPSFGVGLKLSLDEPTRNTHEFEFTRQDAGLTLADVPQSWLRDPRQLSVDTHYDPETRWTTQNETYEDVEMTKPVSLDEQTYLAFKNRAQTNRYWQDNVRKSLAKSRRQKRGGLLEIKFRPELGGFAKSIIGEGESGLRVSGFRKILFSGTSSWSSAEQGSVQNEGGFRQSKFPSLSMEQVSRFTVEGNVGDKITVKVAQDSKSTTSDLANRIILRYKGHEDDILQSIEAGNTNLSLPNTKFVGYSQAIRGLFGIKATATVGPLDFTVITSQEKGNTVKTRFTAGGSQENITDIRDVEYLRSRYFWIGRSGERLQLPPGDSIAAFELYEGPENTAITGLDVRVWAYVGANTASESELKDVRVLPRDQGKDYLLLRKDGSAYLFLTKVLRAGRILAYRMVIRRAGGSLDTIGTYETFKDSTDVDGDPAFKVELLKVQNPQTTSATWGYEWKNVYDLRAGRALSYDNIEVDIYKGPRGTEDDGSNVNHQNRVPYLQILGLDLENQSHVPQPDGKIDNLTTILDLQEGHLLFPNERPFDPQPDIGYAILDDFRGETLNVKVPEVYDQSNDQKRREASEYYIRVRSVGARSSRIPLGRTQILEDSETITLDNRRLSRGVHYTMDYEIGVVTFTDEVADQVRDPNSDLNIDFEYSPFISAEKKTLFGIRSEYRPGGNFSAGSTFLFKQQKSTDFKPKLGQEPSRDMVFDYDMDYKANPRFMTALVDALPLIETEANSSLRLSGEVARSLPNPNTRDEVFIDDFEGSELNSSLGVLRPSWHPASPPINAGVVAERMGRAVWWNPFTPFSVQDIYEREVRNNQSRTTVLMLWHTPHTDSAGGGPESSWSGVMRAMSSSLWDQTQAQFLELRLATTVDQSVGQGVLHVDLGAISEDLRHLTGDETLNQDDNLDNEDRRHDDQNQNGVLDDDEDVGLDGVADSSEISPDGRSYDAETNPDPHGDNWSFDDNDPDNVMYINGTEGNASAGDRFGARPDTEDLGGTLASLDRANNYYSFAIDLADGQSPFLVEGSDRPSRHPVYGNVVWRTYRIPLWPESDDAEDVEFVGQPDFKEIKYTRMWIDGAVKPETVFVAGADIVEMLWLAQEVETTLDSNRIDPPSFFASVINTEEDTAYFPPPGVSGEFDRQTQVRLKEQSLRLEYNDFIAGDTGRVRQQFIRVQDYTGYQRLKLWVWGDASTDASSGQHPLEFFLRLHSNPVNYYEYRLPLKPGWDSNLIDLEFDRATELKDKLLQLVKDVGGGLGDTDTIPALRDDPRFAHYRIHGNPSLSRVQIVNMGVRVSSDTSETGFLPATGAAWVDEMNLSGVRKDPGTAARISLTTQFADLFGFTANFEHRSSTFQSLTSGRRNLQNSSSQTRFNFNASFGLHKFLPSAWGLSLPLAFKYSEDRSVPRLLTGSDIVLTPERRQEESTVILSRGVSGSFAIRPKASNWLLDATLKQINANFSYRRNEARSPQTPRRDLESYNVSSNYRLNIKNRLGFRPIGFLKHLPLFPHRLAKTEIFLLPKSFNARGDLRRDLTFTKNTLGYENEVYTRNFSGSGKLDVQPMKALTGSYEFSTQRDLSDPELVSLVLNPREFQLGTEQQYSQGFRSSYQPQILSFLRPSAQYSANYRESANTQGVSTGIRNGKLTTRWGVSGNLDITKVLGKRGPKRGGRRRGGAGPTQQLIEQQQAKDDTTKAAAEKPKKKTPGRRFNPLSPVVGLMRFLTSPIQPIRLSYGETYNEDRYGLVARPTLAYRFGIERDPGVDVTSVGLSGSQQNSRSESADFQAKSGLNLLNSAQISTSYAWSENVNRSTLLKRQKSVTFPKVGISMSKLERFKLIDLLVHTLTAKTDFSRKIDEQADSLVGGVVSRTTADRFGPLLGLSLSWKSGLRATATFNRSKTVSERFTPFSENVNKASDYRFTLNYSFRAPRGIGLPFLRSLRLKSTMSSTINVTRKNTESLTRSNPNDRLTVRSRRSDLSVSISLQYSFSSRMKGGAQMQWGDNSDQIVKRTHHTRSLAFWVEFQF